MTGTAAIRQALLKLPVRARNGKKREPAKQPNLVTIPCANPASMNALRH